MHTTSIAETAFTPTTELMRLFNYSRGKIGTKNSDLLALLPIHSYTGAELQRQVAVTKLLLSFNSFPDIPDGRHLTPLHYASFFGPLELVKPLVTALLDRKITFKLLTQQLIDQPKYESPPLMQFTPLMYACASGHLQIVEYLLTQVSLTSTTTVLHHDSRSALNIAIQYKHMDVVKLLIKFEQKQDNPPTSESEDHLLQALKSQDRYLFAIGFFINIRTISIKIFQGKSCTWCWNLKEASQIDPIYFNL
jgi:ankyrin repeat protein